MMQAFLKGLAQLSTLNLLRRTLPLPSQEIRVARASRALVIFFCLGFFAQSLLGEVTFLKGIRLQDLIKAVINHSEMAETHLRIWITTTITWDPPPLPHLADVDGFPPFLVMTKSLLWKITIEIVENPLFQW